MSRTSPTQRSLAHLKRCGLTAQVVEKWVTIPNYPGGGVRKDLFGGIDLIYLEHEPPNIVGVQVCAASGLAAHRRKLLNEPRMLQWLVAGGLLAIHSWQKEGPRNGRKRWVLTDERIHIEHFSEQPHRPLPSPERDGLTERESSEPVGGAA